MISDRSVGIERLVLLGECVLVTVVFWAWFGLWDAFGSHHDSVMHFLIYNEFVLLGLVLGFYRPRTCCCVHIQSLAETLRHSAWQTGTTLFFLLLYLAAKPGRPISRLFLFSFIPVLYLVLVALSRFLPSFLGRVTFRKGQEQKVLLVGPKHKAAHVKRWLEQHHYLGLEVVGLLTDDLPTCGAQPLRLDNRAPFGAGGGGYQLAPQHGSVMSVQADAPVSAVVEELNAEVDRSPAALNGTAPGPAGALRVLGRPEQLPEFLLAPGLMQVVLVELPRSPQATRHYTALCEAHGVRLLVLADLDRIFGRPLAAFEDQGMLFIGLREEPLEDPVNRFLKRCLDIAICLPVVLFLLPLAAALVWLFQRLQSPGPLLYSQTRPGCHNRPFSIFKFRTLHTHNPDVNRLPTADDPRVYPAGRWFRKLSIDELPQFLNVLAGEMSVVGPRPHLTADHERFHRVYSKAYVRNCVKPGITGLAQARGFRGSAETPEEVRLRMESDIEYLENWSFWLDCRLIVRTALQMFVPPRKAI